MPIFQIVPQIGSTPNYQRSKLARKIIFGDEITRAACGMRARARTHTYVQITARFEQVQRVLAL